jgi:hypothetical protein
MNTALEFRSAKLELESIFGNVYQVYDRANHLTSYSFTGLVDQKIYKDYIRRIVTTTSEVPYLISGFAIAISGFPTLRQEVIASEPHTLQNQVAYWTVYTKRDNDPILLTVQSL